MEEHALNEWGRRKIFSALKTPSFCSWSWALPGRGGGPSLPLCLLLTSTTLCVLAGACGRPGKAAAAWLDIACGKSEGPSVKAGALYEREDLFSPLEIWLLTARPERIPPRKAPLGSPNERPAPCWCLKKTATIQKTVPSSSAGNYKGRAFLSPAPPSAGSLPCGSIKAADFNSVLLSRRVG